MGSRVLMVVTMKITTFRDVGYLSDYSVTSHKQYSTSNIIQFILFQIFLAYKIHNSITVVANFFQSRRNTSYTFLTEQYYG
jgi:hypothetical protein